MYVTNTYNQNNFLYRNDGGGLFSRIDTLSISTDGQHGASNSWADFDNDGDMDLFISHANYGDNNYIYQNLGNGQFELMQNVPMRQDGRISSAAAWGDMDNDGYLDLAVGNGGWYTDQKNLLYHNRGNGDFEVVIEETFVNESAQSEAVTMVDWDNDGQLELAVANRDQRNFFYDNASEPSNNWIAIRFEGTVSNRSAIGTKARLKSMTDGRFQWQLRDVSGHNGRRANSGLQVHFGLGDATHIDSILVKWPSGIEEIYTDIGLTNQRIAITENQGITGLQADKPNETLLRDFELAQNFPNPFNPVTTIRYKVGAYGNTPQQVDLSIYNVLGQWVATLISEKQTTGSYSVQWDASGFASGVYFYKLTTEQGFLKTRKLVLLR